VHHQAGTLETRTGLSGPETQQHKKEVFYSHCRQRVAIFLFSRLKKEGWDMAEPYAGLSEIIVSEGFEKGETIIVLSKSNIDSNKRYYFPFAAFAVKK
jgi:hypothetical protein